MTGRTRPLLLSLVLCGSLNGQPPNILEGIAAVVDEHIILKSDVAQLAQMTALQQQLDMAADQRRFLKLQEEILRSLIDQKIILELAKIDSIEVKDAEVEAALDQQVQNIIAQAGSEARAAELLGQSLKSFRREFWYDMQDRLITERYQQQKLASIKVSRKDVVDFYNTYQDSLPVLPTQVKLRHLLTTVEAGADSRARTLALADSLRRLILAGTGFERLAQEYSQDPGSAAQGGDLGFVRRGSLVPEFEAVAFTLEPGEVSEPVLTGFGYHLIKLLAKQGEKIHVQHILLTPEITDTDESRAYQQALALQDSIAGRRDFMRLARKYSRDEETRGTGGELGWINPADYPVPEISQVINYLEIGQCSPPVRTSFGYHLLWVEAVKPGGRPTLSTHWAELEQLALNHKKMSWFTHLIEQARPNFVIHIYD